MATSDEQRAAWIAEAMRLHYVAVALRWPPPPATRPTEWDEYQRKLNGANAALRAYLDTAQQAPQERADSVRLEFVVTHLAFLGETASDHGGTLYQLLTQNEDEEFIALSGEGRFFPTWRAAIDAALAANPQQSNGAVEKPTTEPDAAIGASQVPEGVANAERSAMQLCPTPNPHIASETKGGGEHG